MAESSSGRGLRIALALSLALNLAVAGVAVGAWWARHGDHGPDRPRGELRPPRGVAPTPYLMALDPDDRREVLRRYRDEAGPFTRNRAELRARFERLLALIVAEPFDREAVRAAIAETRQAASDRQALGEELILDHLAGLSPAGRRAYAERLDRSLKRPQRR
ncbi:periplasmic heavy metal sensor [Rhodobacteraceae bacterium CCMM004]|nr:periplasmic heavy metal sensor [Rhodobacteraceae bacterium CCMM004]